MSMLAKCFKGLAAVVVIAASPVSVVFAVPFGCGMAGDVVDAAGTPAALAFTTAVCVVALAWARYRGRFARSAVPERPAAGSLGSRSLG